MSVPAGSASFNWVADVAAGTSVIFTMSDSQGKVGGASDVETVANSNDASCLNGQSPSSTANPPSLTHPTATSTSTSKSSGTAPATTTVVSGSPTASGGAIAGSHSCFDYSSKSHAHILNRHGCWWPSRLGNPRDTRTVLPSQISGQVEEGHLL